MNANQEESRRLNRIALLTQAIENATRKYNSIYTPLMDKKNELAICTDLLHRAELESQIKRMISTSQRDSELKRLRDLLAAMEDELAQLRIIQFGHSDQGTPEFLQNIRQKALS